MIRKKNIRKYKTMIFKKISIIQFDSKLNNKKQILSTDNLNRLKNLTLQQWLKLLKVYKRQRPSNQGTDIIWRQFINIHGQNLSLKECNDFLTVCEIDHVKDLLKVKICQKLIDEMGNSQESSLGNQTDLANKFYYYYSIISSIDKKQTLIEFRIEDIVSIYTKFSFLNYKKELLDFLEKN